MSEMTLLDLAERCEAATEADRRLDYEIMTATVPTGHAYLWDPHDRNHRYTASLDAALSLVPEGAAWGVSKEPPIHGEKYHSAVSLDAWGPTTVSSEYYATPALAICASALRARHALAASRGENT